MRRRFLAALVGLPFVGAFVTSKAAPVRAKPRVWDARRQPKASALLLWKDGQRSWEHDPNIGLGTRIYKPVPVPALYPATPQDLVNGGDPFLSRRGIRQVAFKKTARFTLIEGTRVPIYKEV